LSKLKSKCHEGGIYYIRQWYHREEWEYPESEWGFHQVPYCSICHKPTEVREKSGQQIRR